MLDIHEMKLLNVIGQGSFGTVYKAFWKGTIVAAKVIPMPATSHERAQTEIDMCRYVLNQCTVST